VFKQPHTGIEDAGEGKIARTALITVTLGRERETVIRFLPLPLCTSTIRFQVSMIIFDVATQYCITERGNPTEKPA
jgi:hypothetical protein